MYAVVRTGGKQYRVEEGRPVRVERLPGEVGATVELAEVLLMADGDTVTVGAPTIEGARVVGTIAEQGRAQKIVVFRYKAKTRSRKKTGHRQQFTRIVVDDILAPGQEPKPREESAAAPVEGAAPPKGRRARKAAAVVETAPDAAAEPEASAGAEAPDAAAEPEASPAAEVPPVAEAAPAADVPEPEKPKRSRRKAE